MINLKRGIRSTGSGQVSTPVALTIIIVLAVLLVGGIFAYQYYYIISEEELITCEDMIEKIKKEDPKEFFQLYVDWKRGTLYITGCDFPKPGCPEWAKIQQKKLECMSLAFKESDLSVTELIQLREKFDGSLGQNEYIVCLLASSKDCEQFTNEERKQECISIFNADRIFYKSIYIPCDKEKYPGCSDMRSRVHSCNTDKDCNDVVCPLRHLNDERIEVICEDVDRIETFACKIKVGLKMCKCQYEF